jgi:hypothetical protein
MKLEVVQPKPQRLIKALVFHDVGEVFHHSGVEGRASGPAPAHSDYGSFASFSDPDGNCWLLQEVKKRASGR